MKQWWDEFRIEHRFLANFLASTGLAALMLLLIGVVAYVTTLSFVLGFMAIAGFCGLFISLVLT